MPSVTQRLKGSFYEHRPSVDNCEVKQRLWRKRLEESEFKLFQNLLLLFHVVLLVTDVGEFFLELNSGGLH